MHCEACEGPIISCLMTHVKDTKGEWVERVLASKDCGYCDVLRGNIHHADCVNEVCPVCKGKLHKCSCFPAELVLGAE